MIKSILDAATDGGGSDIVMYVILGVLVIAIIAMFIFSSKRRKKQEQEAQDLINSVKPGNKVKTIGGICGIVVEVDNEENTFVLETGTEQSGKSYIKFDRQAIYQTDAVVEKKDEKSEEKKDGEVKEEGAAEVFEDLQETSKPAVAEENAEPAAEAQSVEENAEPVAEAQSVEENAEPAPKKIASKKPSKKK